MLRSEEDKGVARIIGDEEERDRDEKREGMD
jgi:hypothetical protein